LILIVAILLWLTVWLVTHVVRIFQAHATDWLQRFTVWSQGRRFIGPISASLLDPREGELRGLATLATLLLGGTVLLGLSLSAAGRQLPSGLDQSLYHFFKELRTPWADAVMVFITEAGDYQVTLPVSLVVFGWLVWQRNHSAIWHWLAALGFGMATNLLFRILLPVSSPDDVAHGLQGYSFPSSHATFSTLVFGFLAALIAREIPLVRRWLVYLAVAFIIISIAFARLYLGIHWLTDTLAGLCLGLIWVTVLAIAYNRHPKTNLHWRGLLAYGVVALLATDFLHVSLDYQADLHRYQPQTVLHTQTRDQWWQGGWRELPQQRLDFQGHRRQDLLLQWAGNREQLQQRLQETGWRLAPKLNFKSMLLWLNPQITLEELPVLPQLHNGREDEFIMVHYSSHAETRWLLRFWDIGERLRESDAPIWVGSISRQKREPRMRLFTFAVDDPRSHVPMDLLIPAWRGLQTQRVTGSNPKEFIILIAD
ncbi:MAG: LssY C-terminal domain-containing protein, partial [Candidatus Competibacteraceae bacterium]|nr:LssY C-terminal domain-containing protein [Candidatus Competibacteraceae bacterium]